MTQGLLTITRDGKVIFKIVAGCNGYNLPELIAAVKRLPQPWTRQSLYEAAERVEFGDQACLVVQGESGAMFLGGGSLDASYREKFSEPEFNPRWSHGTADYSAAIEIPQGVRGDRAR